MSILIHIENYEAFYLDYLEGRLDKVHTEALLFFLEQHPELKLDDNLPSFLPEVPGEHLENSFIEHLKVFDTSRLLSEDNCEQFMIASVEGQLPATREVELRDFIARREYLRPDYELYQKTKLQADPAVCYPGKSGLKRGFVVPLYLRLMAAAASVLIALFFLPWEASGDLIPAPQAASLSFKVKTPEKSEAVQKNTAEQSRSTGKNRLTGNALPQNGTEVTTDENIVLRPKEITEIPVSTEVNKEPLALKIRKPEKPTQAQEAVYLEVREMKDPVPFLTNGLRKRFHADVDLRTAKASKTRQGGFYLKIGKFEFSRKTPPVTDEVMASN